MWAPDNDSVELPMIDRIDNSQQLLASIIESLQQKDTRSLKTYILEHKLKDENIFWELILQIGNCINAETSETAPDFFDVCCRCLLYLVKVGNPKETLLALLEQVDTFIDDVKFKNFLPAIQTSLLKIPSKLFHSLDITLETVSSHLRSLSIPENTQLEGDELKLFHMDKSVVRLVDILCAYLKFLEPFVNTIDVHLDNLSFASKQEVLVLKKHLIRLFEHPLCYLVLTYDPLSSKSDSRLCAEHAMALLSRVETDFHRFLKNATLKSDEGNNVREGNDDDCVKEIKDMEINQEEYDNQLNDRKVANNCVPEDGAADVVNDWDFKLEITPLAKACLAYLIYVEHLGMHKLPAVYRHDYILDANLEIISILLKNFNYPINYKGLLLCKVLTDLVPRNIISVYYLDNPNYMTVINDLIHVMIKCPVKDHRTLATQIFPSLIGRFVVAGRYQIYQSILISSDHSGLKGYLITLLKNDINDNIKHVKSQGVSEIQDETSKDTTKSLSEYFSGKKFEKLLKLALVLQEKETTDMLENSNQIISALNLLRFLILADPPNLNMTGFWDFLPVIDKDFLSPLRRGLDLSKAHYVLELDMMKGGNRDVRKDTEMSVAVEGMTLPMLEEKEKIDLLEKAVNTHHVMLSLLARVSELVDQQKRLMKK
uniref:Glomulin n=1 Tax=Arion vulgaris TaxID=1028688 RepID=A0A0B7AJE7_9EUPU